MNIKRTDGDFNTEILSPIESGVVVPMDTTHCQCCWLTAADKDSCRRQKIL